MDSAPSVHPLVPFILLVACLAVGFLYPSRP